MSENSEIDNLNKVWGNRVSGASFGGRFILVFLVFLIIKSTDLRNLPDAVGVPILIILLGLAIWVIYSGVGRFHDINQSGWWALLLLIPIIGIGVALYLIFKPGDKGPNRYGSDPWVKLFKIGDKESHNSVSESTKVSISDPQKDSVPPVTKGTKQYVLVCPNCWKEFDDLARRICPDCHISLAKP